MGNERWVGSERLPRSNSLPGNEAVTLASPGQAVMAGTSAIAVKATSVGQVASPGKAATGEQALEG